MSPRSGSHTVKHVNEVEYVTRSRHTVGIDIGRVCSEQACCLDIVVVGVGDSRQRTRRDRPFETYGNERPGTILHDFNNVVRWAIMRRLAYCPTARLPGPHWSFDQDGVDAFQIVWIIMRIRPAGVDYAVRWAEEEDFTRRAIGTRTERTG